MFATVICNIMKSRFYILTIAMVISSHSTAWGNNTNSQLPALQKRQSPSAGKWFQLPYNYPLLFKTDGSRAIEVAYTISGFIPPNAGKFTVELCTTSECFPEKAFHFSVRLNKQIVARTHRNESKWAKEETKGGMPFTRGTNFTLEIKPELTKYKISVNGIHFTYYNYAVPKEDVRYIKVYGDVHINRIAESGSQKVHVTSRDIYYLRTLATGDWLRSKLRMIPRSDWRFIIYLYDKIFVSGMNDFPAAYSISKTLGNGFLRGTGTISRFLTQNVTTQDNFEVDLEILDGLIKAYVDNKFTGEFVANTSQVFYQVVHGDGYSQAISECYHIP